MARFILVRHGETEWNRLWRYQGQSDIELNQTGIAQAECISNRLADEKIDAVYSSDMIRAVKTAEIILSKYDPQLEIQQTPLLREMHFGDFEGLNWDEMLERFPHLLDDRQAWRNRGDDFAAPNGECIADVAERISQFAHMLDRYNSDETVLIVAHGGSLQVLMCHFLEIGPQNWWRVRLSNAALSMMETCEQGAALTLLNDVCHLRQAGGNPQTC